MAFTYNAEITVDRDKVRLEIGDTQAARALFSDAELDYFLTDEGGILGASARACEVLAQRFARDYSFAADGFSNQKGNVSSAYADQARRLRSRARGTRVVVPKRVDGYSQTIPADQVTTYNRVRDGIYGDDQL